VGLQAAQEHSHGNRGRMGDDMHVPFVLLGLGFDGRSTQTGVRVIFGSVGQVDHSR